MKVINQVTTCLGIWAAFPGSTVAQIFPPPLPPPSPDWYDADCRATSSISPSDQAENQTVNPTSISAPAENLAGSNLQRRSLHFCRNHGDFFEKTRANWDNSFAGDRYMEFVQGHTAGMPLPSNWSSRTSEPSFFAEKMLGYEDFDCGATPKGCANRLSCDEVLTLTCGDIHRARWVYFIMESMHELSMVSTVVAVSIPSLVPDK